MIILKFFNFNVRVPYPRTRDLKTGLCPTLILRTLTKPFYYQEPFTSPGSFRQLRTNYIALLYDAYG
jgi:hypothetical protein